MSLTDHFTRLAARLSQASGPSANLSQDIRERFTACLPGPVRQMLARRHRRLIIEPDGASAALFFATGTAREALGELERDGDTPLPGMLFERGQTHRHVTELLLPAAAILTRTVSFPAQVRGNLPQVLRYELDRLSPFQAREVVFDYQLQSSKRTDRVTLDLALCRRDQVDGWIKRLNEAGSSIDRIVWPGAWPRANLLPLDERPRHRQTLFSASRLLLILALLLGGASMATPLWQKSQIAQSLDDDVRRVRAQAVAVDEVRQELELARQGSTAVLQQKWSQPPILELLRELTDRLPDDTWIQSMEYNSGEVELRGESGQSTALIAILEQAPGIEGVSFRSPVTQIARTGKERFNISFRFTLQGDPSTTPP